MSGNSKKMRIGIIGCGNMGSSFAKLLSSTHHLYLCDRNPEKVKKVAAEVGAAVANSCSELVKQVDMIILAIKPQDLGSVASEIRDKLNHSQMLVSILAGTPTTTLKHYFGKVTLLRMMPNLALRYGEGVIGMSEHEHLPSDTKKQIESVFMPFGMLLWLPEDKMDALTALTASGPAYVFVIIESIVDAAIAMGFPPDKALPLVLQMLTGSIKMLHETGKHPAELKWQVLSPGGNTIEGLKRMEQEGVRSGIIHTFIAAHERAKQIAAKHQ